MQEAAEPNSRNPRFRDVLATLSGNIIRHLSREGIKEQLEKMRTEGIMPYFASRFGRPLNLGLQILRGREVMSIKDAVLNVDRLGDYEVISLGLVDSAPSGNLIDLLAFVCPETATLTYSISDDLATPFHNVLPEKIAELSEKGEVPIALITPPTFTTSYDYDTSYEVKRLSDRGILRFAGGTKNILNDFAVISQDQQQYIGGILLSDSGEVSIVDYNGLQAMVKGAAGMPENSYLLQGKWYIDNTTAASFVRAFPNLNTYNAIGLIELPSGEQKLFFLQCLNYTNANLIVQVANAISNRYQGKSWRLLGVEYLNGGINIHIDSDTREVLRLPLKTRDEDTRIRTNNYQLYTTRSANFFRSRADAFILIDKKPG